MTPGITPAPFFKKKIFKSLLAKQLTGGFGYRFYRRYRGSHAAMALFGKSGPWFHETIEKTSAFSDKRLAVCCAHNFEPLAQNSTLAAWEVFFPTHRSRWKIISFFRVCGRELCEAFLQADFKLRTVIAFEIFRISGKSVHEEAYWWIRVPVLPAIPWQPCSHGAFWQKQPMISS